MSENDSSASANQTLSGAEDESSTVYFDFVGPIDQPNARDIMIALNSAVKAGAKHIYLGMSSPGGRTVSGIHLYNYLKNLPVELTTHNKGFVESAAVSAFLAGKIRVASPISTFMLHRPSQNLPPQAEYSADYLSFIASGLRHDELVLRKVLTESTGMSDTQISEIFQFGKRFLPEDAKAAGIITDVRHFIAPPERPPVVLGC